MANKSKKSGKEGKTRLSVLVPSELVGPLDDRAKANHRNRSQHVTFVIEKHLADKAAA